MSRLAAAESGAARAQALKRLGEIKHLVVLMMENRSFDQMLGHLKLDGMSDVNGLTGNEANEAGGVEYKVHPFAPDETVFHPDIDPSGKILDPCHGKACVTEQIAGGAMSGFVDNFLKTRREDHGVEVPEPYRGLVMGYYTADHLPVYDHLARSYCVCDAWHASVPGDTWPNRLYALSGTEADSIGHRPGIWSRLLARLAGFPLADALRDAPIFETEAFTRHLEDRQWRWYSHDPATLRAADGRYRSPLARDNFTYFNRKRVSAVTEIGEAAITTRDSFLDDAAKGELRDLSWIDPNFIDLSVLDPNSEDDHPPSDIRAGQALVLELYEALANSPAWEDTLLVIAYDEHGGFYDHAPPPPVPPGDGSCYETLGVRVPALLIGPRVKRFVCHEVFEHTSLIATILRRFAPDPEAAIAAMPPRVRSAPHLGVALESEPRTDISEHGELRDEVDKWRRDARTARRARPANPSDAVDGAGHEMPLHEFQEGFLKFSLAMREKGLPPGQP
jgi:phospholipase C